MMKQAAKAIGTLGIAVLLASCSGGTDTITSQSNRFTETGKVILDGISTQNSALPVVTRERLDRLTVSSLEVTIPSRDGTAYLIPLYARSVPSLGTVQAWTTADGAQVVLGSGAIVATRGIGDDVTSSNRQGSLNFIRSRAPGRWALQIDVQTSADGVQSTQYVCNGTNAGQQTLEIVERKFSVFLLQENCQSEGQSFQNQYWVDTRDGTVWQSRQWAGEKLGYIGTRLLKK